METVEVIKELCIGCGSCCAICPKNFDFDDGLFFRYALFRALWARGIMPTLSGANNLRLFLGQRVR